MFVASGFALVNLDLGGLEARDARGEKGLKSTIKALKTTSTHLSSAQLGIALTTLPFLLRDDARREPPDLR